MKEWSDFQITVPAQSGPLGDAYTTCPQCAGTRKKKNAKCLSINLLKSCWKCHHCGWSGTLKVGEQSRARTDRFKAPVYLRPAYVPSPPPDPLIEVFQKRGISKATLERYRITLAQEWLPSLEQRVSCIQFPYFRGDQCINIKSRALTAKEFRQVVDAEKIFYGLNDVQGVTTAIIVEGEIDKLSFAEAGIFHCLSVPDGAPPENAKPSAKKFEFLENCEAELERLTKIILAVDADGPGKALEQELARRLGPERCWRVEWPDGCKDANDALQAGGVALLEQVVAQATPWPLEGIISAVDVASDLIHYYHYGATRGVSTGYANLDQWFTMRPGELTVVTGIPSHGKSEFLDSLIINLAMLHGWLFAICSPENLPLQYHLSKLCEKIIGRPFFARYGDRMLAREVAEALEFLQQHFFFLDLPDEGLTIPNLLKKVRALVARQGITGVIIDPWNEFDHSRPRNLTETEYISMMLSRLKRCARLYQLHIFVVAHPQKLQLNKDNRYPIPTPYDISGSANWFNKPDNCLCIWRDIHSEEYYCEAHIQKVRHRETGRPGMVAAFHWQPSSGRYLPMEIREEES